MNTTPSNAADSDGTPLVSLETLAEAIRAQGDACEIVGENGELPQVCGVAIDSRKATPGCLFICKGASFKPAFLASAAANGASAFLCQGEPDGNGSLAVPADLTEAAPGMPAIVAADVRRAMAAAAKAAYGDPSQKLEVVGITGTKGKSTTSYMLRSILNAAGIETSMLGSIVTDDGTDSYESHNTTPESPDLWRHLSNTVKSGRKHMVMEVSSQGLKYDRVLGLNFDIACFLNIGRDHISPNEHPSFEDYFESKLRIFGQCEVAVVNLGTDLLDEVLEAAKAAPRVVTTSSAHTNADFYATQIHSENGALSFSATEAATGEAHFVKLGISGLFNVDNALCAIACARELGIEWQAICEGLSTVRVPGRMATFASKDGHVLGIVDYAHNELSFKAFFSSIRAEYPERRIIAVFGAAGSRAFDRRHVLPEVASQYADLIVYTEDDPTYEKVEDICAQMASNTPESVEHTIICNREQAFSYAVERACEDARPAIVVALSRGSETLQHRGDSFIEEKSDMMLAQEYIVEASEKADWRA